MNSSGSVDRGAPDPLRSSANRVFLSSLGVLWTSWFLWWLALYPGIMSADSLDQWAQAQSFQFNDWHPYLYALLLSGLKLIHFSPSMMGLLQILVTALLVAIIARYVRLKGVNWRWIVLVVAVYALYPQFGDYNVTIWKDVLFSVGLFAQAFLVYVIALDRDESWWPYVLLGFLAGLSVSLRANGVLNLVLPAALLLFSAVRRRRIVLVLVLAILTQVFFGVVLFNALHVRRNLLQMDQIRVKTVGAIYRLPESGPSLTAEQARVFESMMPPSIWASAYMPFYSNELFFDHFSKLPQVEALTLENAGRSPFYRDWKRAVIGAAMRNPGALLKDKYLQTLFFLLSPDWPGAYVTTQKVDEALLRQENYPNVESVLPWARFSGLRAFYTSVLVVTGDRGLLGQLFWAPGWVLLAYLGMLACAVWMKCRATLLYICAILGNVVFVIAVSPASDYRYLYFAALAVFVLPLLILAERRFRSPESRTVAIED